MSQSNAPRAPISSEPGPFRADQIREGSPYELSNGHPIRCMSAGGRHAQGNSQGAQVLSSDPAELLTGVDAGFAFNDGKGLRAPDISVGNVKNEPGWLKEAPPLAVEYADRGQDEAELQDKIADLLEQGTRFVWVVRLTGPLRVEVYEPGRPVRLVDADGSLTAEGILKNPVPVRALVDPAAASEATLRNLLNRKGYADLAAVRDEGHKEGLVAAVVDLCEVFDIAMTPARRAELAQMDIPALSALRAHLKQHRRWR